MRLKQTHTVFLILLSALILISCSVSSLETIDVANSTHFTTEVDSVLETETPQPTNTVISTEEDKPESAEAVPTLEYDLSTLVTSLADVKNAVIKIEAQGVIIDPEFGVYSGPAFGSGFIIHPSGLAITNNHVVSGATQLKVWIGIDTTVSVSARIVAVSECADLALIDIDGTGFSYLKWSPDPISNGLEIYAAGFPDGEPEYILSNGSITDEEANGDTRWASLDDVIEHDAAISPGNSGGPLVTGAGQIVGVNYASMQEAGHYFAIGRDAALPILDIFLQGNDVDSLGINAFATSNSDESLSGVWVSSVILGSPADEAGIEPGDLITTIAGLPLADDGSMATYCDIIRTEGIDNTLSLEVIRLASNDILEGQINGYVLTETEKLGDSVDDGKYAGVDTDLAGGPYSDPGFFSTDLILEMNNNGTMSITDDSGALTIEVPDSWNQIDGTLWSEFWGDLQFEAASLAAAPDLDAFFLNKHKIGVMFSASNDWGAIGGYIQLLDGVKHWYNTSCILKVREEFSYPVYEGAYDFWDCGEGFNTVVISARPIADPTAFLTLVQVQGVINMEEEVMVRILNTFNISGNKLP